MDNGRNEIKAKFEELRFKAQRLVDVIENPHPTKYIIQVGMASGLLSKYLDELKALEANDG